MINGFKAKQIYVTTSETNRHSHSLKIQVIEDQYVIARCDGRRDCLDGHSNVMTKFTEMK